MDQQWKHSLSHPQSLLQPYSKLLTCKVRQTTRSYIAATAVFDFLILRDNTEVYFGHIWLFQLRKRTYTEKILEEAHWAISFFFLFWFSILFLFSPSFSGASHFSSNLSPRPLRSLCFRPPPPPPPPPSSPSSSLSLPLPSFFGLLHFTLLVLPPSCPSILLFFRPPVLRVRFISFQTQPNHTPLSLKFLNASSEYPNAE